MKWSYAKKLTTVIGLMAAFVVILVACSDDTQAGIEETYEVVGRTTFGDVNRTIYELRHKETGCHYTYGYDAGIVQMFQRVFDGKEHLAVPYCTEK